MAKKWSDIRRKRFYVLPEDIRDRLWPKLREARSVSPKRSNKAILDELMKSAAGLPMAPARSSDV
jgi:hypothetical protein